MLTGKQRGYLRGLANGIPAIFQVGKNGLDVNSIRQYDEALEARELVKASVMKNSTVSAREASETIASELNAEVIQVVGNRFVLYRESKEKKVIDLP